MPLADRESVRQPFAPPRPGPLHAVLWAGPSPESTASICELIDQRVVMIRDPLNVDERVLWVL